MLLNVGFEIAYLFSVVFERNVIQTLNKFFFLIQETARSELARQFQQFVLKVPVLVVFNPLMHIPLHLYAQFFICFRLLDEAVHCLPHCFFIIYVGTYAGGHAEFVGHARKQPPKETVDGFDAKEVVIVNNGGKCLGSAAAHFGLRRGWLWHERPHFLQHVVAAAVGEVVEKAQDTLFHLCRSLVGKGHCQYSAECLCAGVGKHQGDVLGCERVSLARAGRRGIYFRRKRKGGHIERNWRKLQRLFVHVLYFFAHVFLCPRISRIYTNHFQ